MARHVLDFTGPFDLAATLDCGQAFRWREASRRTAGSGGTPHGTIWEAVVEGELARVWVDDGALVVECDGLLADFWRNYFALDVDYAALHAEFCKDDTLAKCVAFAPGIRVLRQPFFETLISFVISQNNNIPRIKGIVERLCMCSGGRVARRRVTNAPPHTFPTPERLAALSPEDLAPLRSGYRAPAILDAARRAASGELNAGELRVMPFAEARKRLLAVHGVGPKIADCVLLFGLGRFEAFPVDVWMRRAMSELFPAGLPPSVLPHAGIAQQYIFHYARNNLNV